MKQYSYENFYEMEGFVYDFCAEEVLFCGYEADDLVKCYISNIFTFYIQEMILRDCNEHGINVDVYDLVGNVDVSIPDELIDFYRGAVDLNDFDIPEEKKPAPKGE